MDEQNRYNKIIKTMALDRMKWRKTVRELRQEVIDLKKQVERRGAANVRYWYEKEIMQETIMKIATELHEISGWSDHLPNTPGQIQRHNLVIRLGELVEKSDKS